MKTLLAVIACLAGSVLGQATRPSGSDWADFRGPGGSAVSSEKGLARTFPAAGPKVLWKIPVTQGWACPAIRDGEVFLLERNEETRMETLRVLDLETGKDLWKFEYLARPKMSSYGGSRNTPVVTDKRVFLQSPVGPVHCVDRATHKALWQTHLLGEGNPVGNPGFNIPRWGYSRYPVLYEKTVILSPQTDDVGLFAVDQETGKQVWTTGSVGRIWFSNAAPKLVTLCGVDQVITMANEHRSNQPAAVITSNDAKTGKLLWQTKTLKRYNVPIPQPVKVAENRLFFGGGYTIGLFAIEVTKAPDGTWKTEFVVKNNDNGNPHMHAPTLYEGNLYVQSFDSFHQKINHGLTCLSLTGEQKWRSGPDKTYDNGGFVIADGAIYVMDGKTGELSIIEAKPDAYRELAKGKVLEAKGAQAWSELALSNGRLIVRDLETMACVDLR